jgi:hypothetical protein
MPADPGRRAPGQLSPRPAVSLKALLEDVATTGIVPPVLGYRITHDPFGQTVASEMIPQGFRSTLGNWGTFIYSAPPP